MQNDAGAPGADDPMAKKDQEEARLKEIEAGLSSDEIVLGIISFAWQSAQIPGGDGYEENKSLVESGGPGKKETPMSLEFVTKAVQFVKPETDQATVQEIIDRAIAENKVTETSDGKFITTLDYASELLKDKDKYKALSGILADGLMSGTL